MGLIKRDKIEQGIIFACSAVLLMGCGQIVKEGAEPYSKSDVAMGTVVSETIYSSGEDSTDEVMDRLREVESQYLSWRVEDSDIARINDGSGTAVNISRETADYLGEALELAKNSQGAFDPTIGDITRLWDIAGENPHIPKEEEIQELLQKTGYEKIVLNDRNAVLESGVTIDLGAVGKGIGCDEAAKLLKENEQVSGAVIAVGGSIVTYGEKPDGSDWKVAISNPRGETGTYLGTLSLKGEHYISTSGDYQRYFQKDGVRYHHIMDPSTGYPADSGLISVTILCDNGLVSDGLSTACFVLGMERSQDLLKTYQAEAIFVDEEKNVYLSEGMEECFILNQEGYTQKKWQN